MTHQVGSLEIKERELADLLIGALFGGLLAFTSWWLWAWALALDAPAWSYWFAGWVGVHTPIPKFYIRKRG